MSITTPAEYYRQQQKAVAALHVTVKKQADAIALWRVLSILSLVFCTYKAFSSENEMLFLIAALLLGLLLYILKRQSQLTQKTQRLELHAQLLKDELKALDGNLSAFYNGDAYINTHHPFSYDLDIFGNRSIYQLLNRTVTTYGADNLAQTLQQPYAGKETILQKQEAIKELAANPEYMHQYRVTGMMLLEEQGAHERIIQWLKQDNLFAGKQVFTILLYIVPVLSVIFGILSVMEQTLHPGLITMLVVNWGVNIRYGKKVKQVHYLVGESVKLVAKSEQLLRHMADGKFSTSILADIQARSNATIQSLTSFKKLVHLFDNRQNGMVGPLLNSFFLFDVNCITKLEKWRAQYHTELEATLLLVGEMDKYISLGNYAFNHPHNVLPAINETSTIMEATDLRHPLLHANASVGNSFSIGRKEQLYMLTGANMTGKSTFIRTVGTNLVLAYTGVPLPGISISFPLINIYTSIRVTDSVQDDVSYFKAELQRMQQLMQEVGHSATPYLVLLDEPLRGTNSADKQAGTKAIVEKLLRFNAIGIIATHDTVLCAMEQEHAGKISNYHFESEVANGKLQFDYTLKAGGSTSNNATLLMQLMGITG